MKINIHQGMRSGIPTDDLTYRKVGKFLIPIGIENTAERIYSVSSNPGDGMGGRELIFKLDDGTEFISRDTWACAASYLPKDEYEKIKNTYYSFGIVSKKNINSRNYGGYVEIEEEDILFCDDTWVLGSFDRPIEIANKIAEDLGYDVYYHYSTSNGGSSYHTKVIGDIDRAWEAKRQERIKAVNEAYEERVKLRKLETEKVPKPKKELKRPSR